MSFASQSLIKETQKVLLGTSYSAKLAMLRKRPISPPDGTVGSYDKNGLVMVDTDQKNPDGTFVQGPQSFQKLKMDDLAAMVGFLRLRPAEGPMAGAITFEFKPAKVMRTTGDRVGWIPCWFLPWKNNQIIKFKIKSITTDATLTFTDNGIAPMANPGLFFTAAINGCSVFVIGDSMYPSVYHAGLGPGDPMPLIGNETTEEGWRRLLGRANSAKNITSVGKTDYISELTNTRAVAANMTNADRVTTQVPDDIGTFNARLKNKNAPQMYEDVTTTRRALDLEQRLANNGKVTKTEVKPWGAVFGLRDNAGVWHMNLVKNVSVTYLRVTYKSSGFLGTTKTRVEKSESTPKSLRWQPDGAVDFKAMYDPSNMAQYPKIRSVANLGHQEFFPGTLPANYRSLKHVMAF